MISLKTIFVISILISGVIFTPSYSFAQDNQEDNIFSSLFETLKKLFSFEDKPSDSITEFGESPVIQTSSTSSTEENIAPIANAGPDQTVLEFTTVRLDGSSSTDVDGTIQSYLWTQVSDPPVKLSSNFVSNPTFDAPKVESDDIIIRFSLKVTDDVGGTSTDEVDIAVKSIKSPPTANAGPDQTVLEFTTVTLDGSSSTDTNGSIQSFEWSQTDGPQVILSSLTAVNPTFTAPDVDSNVILIFNLKVIDDDDDMDDDNVKVTVKDSNDNDSNDNDSNDNNSNDNNNDKNVEDDNKGNKVTICHRPPGNPNNSHTITVGESAVNAHMKHGDILGECNADHSDEKNDSRNGTSEKENNDDDTNDENDNNNEDDNKKNNSNNDNSNVDNSSNGTNDKNQNKNDDNNNEDDNKKNNSNNDNSNVDNSNKEKDNQGKENKNKDD